MNLQTVRSAQVHAAEAAVVSDLQAKGLAPLTFGQKAVGLTFNPSGDPSVANCKGEFAAVIDRMNDLRTTTTDPEVLRMASIAITEAQGAQMWAVKALTWKP
jgi:hypothetical protein